MEFCKQFNARTQDKAGKLLPAVITVYSDKSFDFVVQNASGLQFRLKEATKLKSGSGEPNKKKVATVSRDEVRKIAEEKMPDLNAFTVEVCYGNGSWNSYEAWGFALKEVLTIVRSWERKTKRVS